MFDKAVKGIVKKLIKEEYSHISSPSTAYGIVTRKTTISEGFKYTIALTDARGTLLNVPVIPMVKSTIELEVNSSIALAFIEGKKENAYILGAALL